MGIQVMSEQRLGVASDGEVQHSRVGLQALRLDHHDCALQSVIPPSPAEPYDTWNIQGSLLLQLSLLNFNDISWMSEEYVVESARNKWKCLSKTEIPAGAKLQTRY